MSKNPKSLSVSEKQATQLVKLLKLPKEQRNQKELDEISSNLENVKFLKHYQETAEYSDMLKNLELESWPLDHVLFKQGDEGDKFYIILTGVIGLFINIDKKVDDASNNNILGQGIREVAKLYAGDAFGELSLLFNEQRTATAVCIEPTNILVLNKQIFDKYLSNAKNETLDTMVNFFKSLWIFKDLTHKEILKLSTKTTLSKCNSSTIIIRQGEKPKGIFFVHNGIAKIIQTIKFRVDPDTLQILDDYRDPNQQQIRSLQYKTVDMELEEFGNGSYFADYEVFNDLEVTYSAVSMTPLEILTITNSDLKSVLRKEVYEEFQKTATYYPSAQKIKKQFFENLMWKNFKSKVMLHYNHHLINEKTKNETRIPFLNLVDLNVFNIYDDVGEAKDSNNNYNEEEEKQDSQKYNQQQQKPLDHLYSQFDHSQSQQNDLLNSGNNSKQQQQNQQKQNQNINKYPKKEKKFEDYLLKAPVKLNKTTKNREQAEIELKAQRQKLGKQANTTNKKQIVPKINTKNNIYGIVKQIY